MEHSTVQREGVFVGIDYHQHTLQVCVLDTRGRVLVNQAVANDWSAVVQAVPADAAGALPCVRRVAIESCNGAADLADQLTELAGWIAIWMCVQWAACASSIDVATIS